MIDSGATSNFVSFKAVSRIGLQKQEKQKKYPLRLVDGTLADFGMVTHETRTTPMKFGTHEEGISFDITDTGADEVILGMPWLQEHNPTIDWNTGRLRFPRCTHDLPSRFRIPSEDEEHDTQIMRESTPVLQTKKRDTRWLSATHVDTNLVPAEYRKYKLLWKEDLPDEALPKHQAWDHEIPIQEGKSTTFGKVYPMNEQQLKALKEYLDENLKKKFIRESKSPAGYPLFFVPKKGGKLRPVIDYRQLNEVTVKNRYPLPLIGEMMDRTRGAYWFTKMDLRGAYNLVRMKEGEEWKTAFRTKYGLYEYLVMPFGLTNAPATFQAFINNVLRDYLDDFVVVYLDDILIFSKTLEEHRKHVHAVLEKLEKADLRVSPDKSAFHKQEVEFLGFVIRPNEIRMDPAKITSIKEWPTPKNVKDIQSFLGFGNFYRRFIQGYSAIVNALTKLTRKDIPFAWRQEQQRAFDTLKERFTTAPILVTFDPERPITVETDASDYAIGACLSQPDDNGKLHPVAFYSRSMSPAELNYDIHDKELLAIVAAFKQWKVYLEGPKHQVSILTDHKNLIYFTSTKVLNRRQVRWSEELAVFNYKITYQKGSENNRADALSRRSDYLENKKPISQAIFALQPNGDIEHNTQRLAATFQIQETHWKQDILNGYANDAFAKTLEATPSRDFTRDSDNLWIIDNRVYVPLAMHQRIIREIHDQDHQGVGRTMERIMRHYYVPRLRNKVEDFVKSCDTCQRSRHERHKPYGLLQPLPAPPGAWKSISMDFITDLPRSTTWTTKDTFDTILVVVDRLTKYVYFLPFYKTGTARQLAQLLVERVFCNHGTPSDIVSDRDKLFLSHFWQTTMELLNVRTKLSTSFHPQTDGQTERTNQTLEQYLRAFVNYKQTNWASLLPIAQFTCNTYCNASTTISPFQAVYGILPTLRFEEHSIKTFSEAAKANIDMIKATQNQLRMELAKASTTQIYHANKHRSGGPDLKEGDTVYLRRKNIKTKRPSNKLDVTKLGPFVIQKKLGPVTFRLKLPRTMRIHPVFHIGLLEPTDNPPKEQEPVEIDEETQEPLWEVEDILDHRQRGNTTKYLVKWKGYGHEENTWEPATHFSDPAPLQDYRRRTQTQSPEERPAKKARKTRPRRS